MHFLMVVRYFIEFVFGTAFKEGELDPNKSTFNSLKLIGVVFLTMYLACVSLIAYKAVILYNRIEENYPGVIQSLSSQEDELGVLYHCEPQPVEGPTEE